MAQILTPEVFTQTLGQLLAKNQKQIASVLPKHMTPERFLRVAMISCRKNPKLMQCSPESILGSVLASAELGLEPDNGLGHAYLVPYWNNKLKALECQLQVGYKGFVELMTRSGRVEGVEAATVFERDTFSYCKGLKPQLIHKPSMDADPGPAVAYYAIVRRKGASCSFEVMSVAQVEKFRLRSQSHDKGPWVTDYDWMGKKTVIRQLSKLEQLSPQLARATALDELAAVDEPQSLDIEFQMIAGGATAPPAAARETKSEPATATQAPETANAGPGKEEAQEGAPAGDGPPEPPHPADSDPGPADAAPGPKPPTNGNVTPLRRESITPAQRHNVIQLAKKVGLYQREDRGGELVEVLFADGPEMRQLAGITEDRSFTPGELSKSQAAAVIDYLTKRAAAQGSPV